MPAGIFQISVYISPALTIKGELINALHYLFCRDVESHCHLFCPYRGVVLQLLDEFGIFIHSRARCSSSRRRIFFYFFISVNYAINLGINYAINFHFAFIP